MDAQPVTGAPAASPPAPDFATFAREADARDLGKPTPDQTTPADSSPAPPAEQAASTDASTAASAAAPTTGKKPRNRETRIAELDAENAELQRLLELRKTLRAELATLERPANPTPASDPAQTAPKATWEQIKHLPGAPKVEDFEAYEDYLDARAEFIVEKRLEARERRATLDAESRERMSATEKRITGFHERYKKAAEADPDYDAKVDPGLAQIVPAFAVPHGQPVTAGNVLAEAMVRSEASDKLVLHFSTPEGREDWNRLVNAETPGDLFAGFGRLEARFLSTGQSSAAPAKAPAQPVTSAPAPPMQFGTRPPVSADRATAAVNARDYRAYESAADAADLAAHRR